METWAGTVLLSLPATRRIVDDSVSGLGQSLARQHRLLVLRFLPVLPKTISSQGLMYDTGALSGESINFLHVIWFNAMLPQSVLRNKRRAISQGSQWQVAIDLLEWRPQ